MMQNTLGKEAVNQVISQHEKTIYERYSAELQEQSDLESRIAKLAEIRSCEGYMADYKEEENGYLFVENHCPICSAAKVCQGFCRAELRTFQSLLGENMQVQRVEHILND